ncbi:MAG: SAM-dependent methyltransferase [Rhodoferax sp.]|uniref:class I SAM-dependent methyltransferase n=1 Tax=Rhodoferax sp. TaxID=50421 RepID=UPI0027308B83|nr:SAM-dependent methyltransferase [Rhodoferax sp.]MDP1530154.1 SAM-dependent methyltransferase [Rhodoferax sp.]MDP1945444.1 SAM-dependent methyltransferase [Rhodoferax sp.]
MTRSHSLTSELTHHIGQTILDAGGWVGFDVFMDLALYTPGLGYYAHGSAKFGVLPYAVQDGVRAAGSDFVTSPEITPLFGWTLAQQVVQALQVTDTQEVWEFGAGSGALALQILQALQAQGAPLPRYTIVDISSSLRARQQVTLAAFAGQVRWVDALPDELQGVVLGNEVLDAMPVKLLARTHGAWHERGVVPGGAEADGTPAFAWADRPTALRPPLEIAGPQDYLTEIHPQGESFVRTLGHKLSRGAVFLIDYGFPETEYYHPQRHMGTVMCHQAHQVDDNPLARVGQKDITAHVNFTGVALAGNEAGLGVLGYCNQGRFLMNCGLLRQMEAADLPTRVMAQKLIMEHEMGELFKVIGFYKGEPWQALGFESGDKTHTL